MNVKNNENTVNSRNHIVQFSSTNDAKKIDTKILGESEIAAFYAGLYIGGNSQQDSNIENTYEKILTGCYSWWESKSKAVRSFLRWWFIIIWPFFITFIASGGDNIINNVINKVFPTKDAVEVICNFNISDNLPKEEKECKAKGRREQEKSTTFKKQITRNLQKFYSLGNQRRKDYSSNTELDDCLTEEVWQELLKHEFLLQITGVGRPETDAIVISDGILKAIAKNKNYDTMRCSIGND